MYLVPIGCGRFELYTEPPDEAASAAAPRKDDGFVRRTMDRLQERWRHAAHTAAQAPHGASAPSGRVARARDWFVRRIAESIAEQRTLWSLRSVTLATLVYPTDLTDGSATAVRQRLLVAARRHHRRWLLANIVGVVLTAALVLLPGPNVIGYYFAFRVVGHYLSWRGAGQGLDRITWRGTAEPALTELGVLAQQPREQRAARVAALSTALALPRLAAFFDRVAAPAR
ncbi:MAG: hypothetical protein JWL71_3043 [Acidobacteria bacterium]|nr:hypothetical protein [Acidobacteriota bacterium]